MELNKRTSDTSLGFYEALTDVTNLLDAPQEAHIVDNIVDMIQSLDNKQQLLNHLPKLLNVFVEWSNQPDSSRFWNLFFGDKNTDQDESLQGFASKRVVLQGFLSFVIQSRTLPRQDDDAPDYVFNAWSASYVYMLWLNLPGAFSYRVYDTILFDSILSLISMNVVSGPSTTTKKNATTKTPRSAVSKRFPPHCDSIVQGFTQQLVAFLSHPGNPVEHDVTVNKELEQRLFATVVRIPQVAHLVTDQVQSNLRSTVFAFVIKLGKETDMVKVLLPQVVEETTGRRAASPHRPHAAWQMLLLNDLLSSPASMKLNNGDDCSVLGLTMLEHYFMLVIDHNEKRMETVNTMFSIITECVPESLRLNTYFRFIQFLSKNTKSPTVNQRLCAIEFVGCMVSMAASHRALLFPEVPPANQEPTASNTQEQPSLQLAEWESFQDLAFTSLVKRTNDKVPNIRTAALKAIVEYLEGTLAGSDQPKVLSPDQRKRLRLIEKALSATVGDEKPNVRRVALKALQLVLFYEGHLDNYSKPFSDLVKLVVSRANDCSVSVRKVVVDILTNLVDTFPTCGPVSTKWLDTVLLLANDRERSIETKCLDIIKDKILFAILAWYKQEKRGEASTASAVVWSAFGSISSENLERFSDAMMKLAAQTAIPVKKLLDALDEAVKRSFQPANKNASLHAQRIERGKIVGGWTLLDFLCGSSIKEEERSPANADAVSHSIQKHMHKIRDCAIEAINLEHVLYAFEQCLACFDKAIPGDAESDSSPKGESLEEFVQLRVLHVLVGIAPRVPAETASFLAERLMGLAAELRLNPAITTSAIKLLVALCRAKSPDTKVAQQMMSTWINGMLQSCESELKDFVLRGEASNDSVNNRIGRALHLVGELSIIGFDPDNKNHVLANIGKNLIHLVQSLSCPRFVATSDEGDNAQDQRDFGELVPLTIRAHAFITIGKFCICDKQIAKSFVLVLVRELVQSSEHMLRSNILVILGDLCKRYTSMIDCHLPSIASCLNDLSSAAVRRHAIVLLCGLLQEDYIKWKGLLLFRFLLATVDTDEEIANIAKFSLVNIFLKKMPTLFHTNMVESMFVFTDFKLHPKHNQMHTRNEDGEDISGQKVIPAENDLLCQIWTLDPHLDERRANIHKFMLENLSGDQQRLEITNKICKDVLGSFLDGVLPISPNPTHSAQQFVHTEQLAKDTFKVLCSSQIRVKTSSSSEDVGAEDRASRRSSMESTGTAMSSTDALAAAKGRVLSKLEKRNVMENIIPITVSLYRMMQRERSPLMRYIIEYMRHLMKHNADEIDQVLSAQDKELVDELKYDLRQEEEAARRKRRLSKMSSASSPFAENSPMVGNRASIGSARKSGAKHKFTPHTPVFGGVTPKRSKHASRLGGSVLRSAAAKNRTDGLSTLKSPFASLKSPSQLMSPMVASAFTEQTVQLGARSVPRLRKSATRRTPLTASRQESMPPPEHVESRRLSLSLESPTVSNLKLKLMQAGDAGQGTPTAP